MRTNPVCAIHLVSDRNPAQTDLINKESFVGLYNQDIQGFRLQARLDPGASNDMIRISGRLSPHSGKTATNSFQFGNPGEKRTLFS